MKIIIKDFKAVYSIICPYCKFRQTGVIRPYNRFTGDLATEKEMMDLRNTQLAIKCCMAKLNSKDHCGRLITEDLLDEVTRKAVKSPSDIRS